MERSTTRDRSASSSALSSRFTEVDDYRWFYKTIERVAEEELGSKYQPMIKKDDYFVDFLRYGIRLPVDSNTHLAPLVEMRPSRQAKSPKMLI